MSCKFQKDLVLAPERGVFALLFRKCPALRFFLGQLGCVSELGFCSVVEEVLVKRRRFLQGGLRYSLLHFLLVRLLALTENQTE